MSEKKSIGVKIDLIQDRLSTTTGIHRKHGDFLHSQEKLIQAAFIVSGWVYNTSTAASRAWSTAQSEFVYDALREHLGISVDTELSDDDRIKLAAYNKAATWVSNNLRKEEAESTSKNYVPLLNRNQKERYVKAPAIKELKGAVKVRDREAAAVDAFDITLEEAIAYTQYKKQLYKDFEAEYGDNRFMANDMTLEQVMRQLTGASTRTYDGETLYIHPSAKQAADGVQPVSFPWRSAFFKQQMEEHKPSFFYDAETKQFMVALSEDEEELYPVPTRVLVQACKDVAAVNKKYFGRFFEGGIKTAGLPQFRTFRDDQHFSTKLNQNLVFADEKAGIDYHAERFIEEYHRTNGKAPTKTILNRFRKQYQDSWTGTQGLANTTRLYLGENLGWVPVNKHKVKELRKLLSIPGAKLSSDYRISSKNGKLSLSMTVTMPETWNRERPASYYLNDEKSIGIDPGVITAVTDSTGFDFPNINRNKHHADKTVTQPRNRFEQHIVKLLSYTDTAFKRLAELEEKKKTLQREASAIYDRVSKEHDENKRETYQNLPQSWHKRQDRIRNITTRMDNINTHHVNVIAKIIASNYDFIGMEDLNVLGLLAKHLPKTDELGNFVPNGQSAGAGLRRAIAKVGLSKLLLTIQQKATFYGTEVQLVDRWFASSLLCSACGAKKDKANLGLGERTYVCTECGVVLDRDHNAALNIRNEALRLRINPDAAPGETENLTDVAEEVIKVAEAEEKAQTAATEEVLVA